jgi:hypothetical protein
VSNFVDAANCINMVLLQQLSQHVPSVRRSTPVFTSQQPRRQCRRQLQQCRAAPTTQVISPEPAPGLKPEPWTDSPQQQQVGALAVAASCSAHYC